MISLHTQLLFIITIRHVILFFPHNLASGQVSSAICDLGQARKPSTVVRKNQPYEKKVFIQKSFSTLDIRKNPVHSTFARFFQTVDL